MRENHVITLEDHACITESEGARFPCAYPLCPKGVSGMYYETVSLPARTRRRYRRVWKTFSFDGLGITALEWELIP